jgi:hypothetical protein
MRRVWTLALSLQFTVVLLLRHLVTVVTVGAANQFAFGLLTVSSTEIWKEK